MQILLETKCNCRRVVNIYESTVEYGQRYIVPLPNPIELLEAKKCLVDRWNTYRRFVFRGRYDLSTGLPVFEEE